MICLVIILLLFSDIIANKNEYNFLSDYTVNDCLRLNNDEKSHYFALDENGFPYCAKYQASIDCNPDNTASCEPGLKCGENHKCIVDTASCFKYYANVEGNENVKDLLWNPNCLEDGTWAPKQCKGGSAGRCFCYNSAGQRIFGDAFRENSGNMTCACSRRKAELLAYSNPHKRSYVSFHCDYQGNFEELQCDSSHCWCVDPKTGEPSSMVVPEKAMSYLSCSNKLQGSQYLRKCESQAYAQAKVMEEMKRHGTSSPNIQMVACGGDGSYGPYSIQNSAVYCVSRNNAKMVYQSPISTLSSVDCNCAIDQNLYTSLGREFTLACNQNGNYKPFQSIVREDVIKSFCVDKDGNKKVDNMDPNAKDEDCTKFFD